MTTEMKEKLKAFILHQRKKKIEETAQNEALKKERKIREIKKQQDSLTLEETVQQIRELEKKLSDLKQEKHDLFTQLKKVLNQEEEHRRRLMQSQQQHYREFNEVLAKVRPTTGMLPLPLSMNDAQFGVIPHTGCYPATLSIPTSPLKRSRSPSSPFNVGLQPFISLQDPKYGDNILRLAAPPVAYEPRSYALNSASDVSMLPTYNDGDGGDPHLKYGPPYVRANVRTASLQLSGMKPSILPNRTGPQNF